MSMRDGTCPECGSTDVRIPGTADTSSKWRLLANRLSESNDPNLDIQEYVCCDCGHVRDIRNRSAS